MELLPTPTLSVGVGRMFGSFFCLSVCLSVCFFVYLEHNSEKKCPKVLKLSIGNDLWISYRSDIVLGLKGQDHSVHFSH